MGIYVSPILTRLSLSLFRVDGSICCVPLTAAHRKFCSGKPLSVAEAKPKLPPVFLLAIDTEGDDLWSQPRQVTTRNARFLPRFQTLCERFGFRPTYLTNFEMAQDAAFCEWAVDVLRRGTAEIGMHMHAWDTPPLQPLGPCDWRDQPYAFQYPPELVERKAATVTRLLQDRLGVTPTSHRAGRFGFDAAYARSLLRLGYKVDCSVTPLIDWTRHPGAPDGSGGQDYTGFPAQPYWLDLDDISRPGRSSLLEVPMTIITVPRPWPKQLARRLLGRHGPKTIWLRPDGTNIDDLLRIVAVAESDGRPYLQFTLHSSEFMPGGSPTFRTKDSIEMLYHHLEVLFGAIAGLFVGETLTGFAERHATPFGPAVRSALS